MQNTDDPMRLLFDVMRLHHHAVRKGMSSMGILAEKPTGLMYLYHSGGCSQSAMAEALGISCPSMATALKRLEKNGLVRRTDDPGDARVKRVELTDRGKEVAKRCDTMFRVYNELMFKGFTCDEKNQLSEYLFRMKANILDVIERSQE